MNKQTQRSIAISAARSYLREQGIDPMAVDAEDGLIALDDLLRIDADMVATQWYASMSDRQQRLFVKDWNAWRQSWIFTNRMARKAHKLLDEGNLPPVLEILDKMSNHLESKGGT